MSAVRDRRRREASRRLANMQPTVDAAPQSTGDTCPASPRREAPTMCVICQEDFRNSDLAVRLRYGHVRHYPCLGICHRSPVCPTLFPGRPPPLVGAGTRAAQRCCMVGRLLTGRRPDGSAQHRIMSFASRGPVCWPPPCAFAQRGGGRGRRAQPVGEAVGSVRARPGGHEVLLQEVRWRARARRRLGLRAQGDPQRRQRSRLRQMTVPAHPLGTSRGRVLLRVRARPADRPLLFDRSRACSGRYRPRWPVAARPQVALLDRLTARTKTECESLKHFGTKGNATSNNF